MNLLQQMPPDTSSYMIAGFSVIFGTMLLYVSSLIIRWRNLEQDMTVLQELEGVESASTPVESQKYQA
jgi:hypothetical protein